MKNVSSLLTVLGLALIAFMFYLFYKTFVIFGFWNLLLVFCVTTYFALRFDQMFSSKVVNADKIVFNPKEWPKLVSVLVNILGGGYLGYILFKQQLPTLDYIYGSLVLSYNAVVAIIVLYRIFRDRNDFVTITNETLSYKDNAKTGEFAFSDVVTFQPIFSLLVFILQNGRSHTLKLSEMSFNLQDTVDLTKEITNRLPEAAKPADFDKTFAQMLKEESAN
jgi:hypothetical protein